MPSIAQFHAEHRELVACANRLVALISRERPPTIEALTAARWELLANFDGHLAREQAFVERELSRSNDVVARSLARRYADELLDLRLAVSSHSGKWNNLVVQSDWDGYRTAVHAQLAGVVKRIAWEERVIFPTIELVRARKAGLAPAVPAVA